MQRKFESFDTDKETKEHTGKLSFEVMKQILHATSYLNIKEVNLLLRNYVMKCGYQEIVYTNFAADLYDVRFDLSRSRLMDINMSLLPDDYLLSADLLATSSDGRHAKIFEVRNFLADSKRLVLTPSQINILLGFAEVNEEGLIDLVAFGKTSK